MLTTRQIDLIKESFARASSDPEPIVESLFDNLFRLDPGLRFLFPEDLSALHRRFGFMLGSLIHRLDRWDEISPRLQNLGVRHVAYGVQVRHYKVFGEALMATLLEHHHVEPHSDCASAWTALYELVTTTMIAAGCVDSTEGVA